MGSGKYSRKSDRAIWGLRAACQGDDLDDYFLHGNSKPKAVSCEVCPVKLQCREYALVHEEYGVWGGMTETDRRAYRRTSDFDVLVFQAKKEGWLEPHNLAPQSLLDEVNGVYEVQTSPREPKPVTALREFTLTTYVSPTFSFS